MIIAMILLTATIIFFEIIALSVHNDDFDMAVLLPTIFFTIALGSFAAAYCYYFEEDFPAISAVIDIDSTEVHKVNDKVKYIIVKDKAGNIYKLEAAPQN